MKLFLVIPFSLLIAINQVQAANLSAIESLGKHLFFDENLSQPAGQSCASCHAPESGFADPNKGFPTSVGVHKDRFGSRNTPPAAYAAYSPDFHWDEKEGLFVGGQFLDGRVTNLEAQAAGPFLNPVEMANPDKKTVVEKVREASYAGQFKQLFGAGALDDVTLAYGRIVSAIANYERSVELNKFSSKYDRHLRGEKTLNKQELLGLKIFEDEEKGNCAACHLSQLQEDGSHPLFTDFTYDNLGVPANKLNPHLTQSKEFNPDGELFVDGGLGARVDLKQAEQRGKFKVSSLRNIAVTPPYMHNGVFTSLREVVDFYNTRDVDKKWAAPEVADNVNSDELGDLKLSDVEVDALIAFMKTLTDE